MFYAIGMGFKLSYEYDDQILCYNMKVTAPWYWIVLVIISFHKLQPWHGMISSNLLDKLHIWSHAYKVQLGKIDITSL